MNTFAAKGTTTVKEAGRTASKEVRRRQIDERRDEEVEVSGFDQLVGLLGKHHGFFVSPVVVGRSLRIETRSLMRHENGEGGRKQHENQEIRGHEFGVEVQPDQLGLVGEIPHVTR